MAAGVDPVRAGFVQSLRRPGGNITGLNADAAPETILGKQLALLQEVTPKLSRAAVLWNPTCRRTVTISELLKTPRANSA
jgi:ABC-type uncharacterized transport system substrate-binding protein